MRDRDFSKQLSAVTEKIRWLEHQAEEKWGKGSTVALDGDRLVIKGPAGEGIIKCREQCSLKGGAA